MQRDMEHRITFRVTIKSYGKYEKVRLGVARTLMRVLGITFGHQYFEVDFLAYDPYRVVPIKWDPDAGERGDIVGELPPVNYAQEVGAYAPPKMPPADYPSAPGCMHLRLNVVEGKRVCSECDVVM